MVPATSAALVAFLFSFAGPPERLFRQRPKMPAYPRE